MDIRRVHIVGVRGRRRNLRSERGLLLERLVDVRAGKSGDFDDPHVSTFFFSFFALSKEHMGVHSFLLLLSGL